MTVSYRSPRLLDATHEIDGFHCRSAEQTEWLRRHARQATSTGTTRVLVSTPKTSNTVIAYYAWCMAGISLVAAPDRLGRGAGRYPQPIALLARLGVDTAHEGHGLSAGLLADVIARALSLGDQIGCRGLLVHAETSAAAAFYRHLVPELEASPTDELHLVLLMKDIRRTFLGDKH